MVEMQWSRSALEYVGGRLSERVVCCWNLGASLALVLLLFGFVFAMTVLTASSLASISRALISPCIICLHKLGVLHSVFQCHLHSDVLFDDG